MNHMGMYSKYEKTGKELEVADEDHSDLHMKSWLTDGKKASLTTIKDTNSLRVFFFDSK